MIHVVRASSFADPADVRAFNAARERGLSDRQAFKFGDNAIGFWGDPTGEGTGPSCALPPEDMIETWGSVENAHLKEVEVSVNDAYVICEVKDTMPHKPNITNGAGIDLNPDAVRALGLEPPIMVNAYWEPILGD